MRSLIGSRQSICSGPRIKECLSCHFRVQVFKNRPNGSYGPKRWLSREKVPFQSLHHLLIEFLLCMAGILHTSAGILEQSMGIGTELSYRPACLCSLAGWYDNPISTRFLAPQIVFNFQHSLSSETTVPVSKKWPVVSSLHWITDRATVLKTTAANFATGTACVVDTNGKFATVVNDTSGNLPLVSTTLAVNLPPGSMTPVANNWNYIRLLTP
jgi:hypothetical protein